MTGARRARSRVRRQIRGLLVVRFSHCLSGSKALDELAAVYGGFVALVGGFIAAAVFFVAAFLAVAGPDLALRAIISSICARKPAISSRSA